MTEPFLEVRNLKTYFPIEEKAVQRRKAPVFKAVDGVSFNLARGETLGLVGESGCGNPRSVARSFNLSRPPPEPSCWRGGI